MLDFCPYEVGRGNKGYRKIDRNRLAYEMIFYAGYSYDSFMKATSKYKIDGLIEVGEDARQADFHDVVYRYMMKAPKGNGKTGPEKLIDWIRKVDSQTTNAESEQKEILFEKIDGEEQNGWGRKDSGFSIDCIPNEDGSYLIVKKNEEEREAVIAQLIPCCPNCHSRLPIGFLNADDYIGVYLCAPAGGGKSTYLTSLYANQFARLKNIGEKVKIVPAHYSSNASNSSWSNTEKKDLGKIAVDTFYEERVEASKMLVNQGICPDPTNTEQLIRPTFLRALVPGKTGNKVLMVGIYDNSGEVLAESQAMNEKIIMLANMYAQIYMIEPVQFGVCPLETEEDSAVDGTDFQDIRLLEIQKQGEYQEDHEGEVITGKELLEVPKQRVKSLTDRKNSTTDKNGEYNLYPAPFDLLTKLESDMSEIGMDFPFQNQHIAFTIIKCDLLKDLDVMQDYEYLFDPQNRKINQKVLWDDNLASMRDEDNKEIVDKLLFETEDGEENEALLESVTYASQSWHLVSALGTGTKAIPNTTPKKYQLTGKYDPIRLEEPLVTCIIKRIKENGWK